MWSCTACSSTIWCCKLGWYFFPKNYRMKNPHFCWQDIRAFVKSKGRTSPDGKTKPRRLHRDTRPSRSILYLGKNHRQTQPATAEKLGRLEFLDVFFCWMTLLKQKISLDSMDFCMFLSKGNAIEMHHTGVSAIFLLGSKSLSGFPTSSILHNNKAFSMIWIQNLYMKLSSTYTSFRSTWIQLI